MIFQRFFVSSSDGKCFAPAAPPFKDAPYPAASTAAMIASADEAVPSNSHGVGQKTDGTAIHPREPSNTAFSTRAAAGGAAHTSYIILFHFLSVPPKIQFVPLFHQLLEGCY